MAKNKNKKRTRRFVYIEDYRGGQSYPVNDLSERQIQEIYRRADKKVERWRAKRRDSQKVKQILIKLYTQNSERGTYWEELAKAGKIYNHIPASKAAGEKLKK